jgi:prevent-host-death family protein
LARNLGDVAHAASQSPVCITQHAKPRFVLMSIEAFDAMRKLTDDPRRVYHSEETPEDVKAWLLPALDKFASGQGDYDD